jgi:hypothetical protein
MMYMKKGGGAKRPREEAKEPESLVSIAENDNTTSPSVDAAAVAIPSEGATEAELTSKRTRTAAASAGVPSGTRRGRVSKRPVDDVDGVAGSAEEEMISVSEPVLPMVRDESEADHVHFAAASESLNPHMSDSSSIISRGRRNDIWETNYQHLVEIGNATGNCNVALSTPGEYHTVSY